MKQFFDQPPLFNFCRTPKLLLTKKLHQGRFQKIFKKPYFYFKATNLRSRKKLLVGSSEISGLVYCLIFYSKLTTSTFFCCRVRDRCSQTDRIYWHQSKVESKRKLVKLTPVRGGRVREHRSRSPGLFRLGFNGLVFVNIFQPIFYFNNMMSLSSINSSAFKIRIPHDHGI